MNRFDATPTTRAFWAVVDAAAARAAVFSTDRLREVGDDCLDMPTDIALPRGHPRPPEHTRKKVRYESERKH